MQVIENGDDPVRLMKLDELRPTDENQNDILLQTIVAGSSEIEHFTRFIVFKCSNCTNEKQFAYLEDFDDWRDIPTKIICKDCSIPMRIHQNTKGQLRKVLLTEQGVANPTHLTGFLYGDDINNLNPGVKLNMRGTLRSRKKSEKDLTYHRHFDVSKFAKTDDKPIVPTEEEIAYFKALDKTKLISSFAPHIYNMVDIKEALLLTCLGGVETDTVRGDINTLLLGDPGVAKTQLLKFVTNIIPKSDYVSGKSASGAGLFGGVDNLSDGTRIAKPGSVTLCNGGIAALDEIEKMNDADRTYCHEIMESQKFSLRKIGIDITWEVKVAIIAAGNPKKSRWNPELSINENVTLPESIMSRFGLIFLIRDTPEKGEDLLIAKHIMKVRRGELKPELDTDMITKFIIYAKTINPTIPEEVDAILLEWWSELRKVEQEEGGLAVDIRTYEDLVRLTQAYARLQLEETATIGHAKDAIKMLNTSLHTLGMDTPGQKNASIANSFDKTGWIGHVFREPVTEDQAIAKLMEKSKWFPTEESARRQIAKLGSTGQILDSGGKYSWVN
jgi:replicative DNA helicase Mcm